MNFLSAIIPSNLGLCSGNPLKTVVSIYLFFLTYIFLLIGFIMTFIYSFYNLISIYYWLGFSSSSF